MRKRAKRAGRRKQSIFGFNHIDPPHSGRRTGRDQKPFSILSQNDLRKKGVDHDEISFP